VNLEAVYLALGSNLGNRGANIALAMRMLAPLARVEAVSRLYQSAPADGSEQPDYYNAACRIVTGLSPDLLLAHAKRVEFLIGRRAGEPWGPRVIDIDIVLYGDHVISTEVLTLPHPHMAERPFVVRPLLDIDPELTLPGTRHRLDALRAATEALEVVAEGEWWRDARAVGAPSPQADD
jgi:2-amino-4-hydroxy-6-hydroxymethyldihydropteridine diphosphokinase